jgi:SAM-dependent methyltransferase
VRVPRARPVPARASGCWWRDLDLPGIPGTCHFDGARSRAALAPRVRTPSPMLVPDYVTAYKSHLAHLIEAHGRDAAMEWIVGGQYAQIGVLESSALITLGLRREHLLVDVGCGSGRLPYTLREYLTGRFVGTDLLEEALDYAREKCGRPDWRFMPSHETAIPVEDATADFVTFFSVFTHLLDEDIFRFLAEATRAARPGGKIVFSYLDFECESHWPIFESTLANRNPQRVINKFISKGAIRRWARALGLAEVALHDGFQPWITLTEPFTYSDGRRAEGVVEFGQSIAVLQKGA